MEAKLTRRAFIGLMGASSLAILGGCAGSGAGTGAGTGAGSSSAGSPGASGQGAASSGASASSAGNASAVSPVIIGTLATEDLLPLWVVEAEGLYADAGVQVDIMEFQSATELIAGVASGEVDLAMTDIMVTASMFASGVDVQMEWVTLGAKADEGRFGIMVGPDSDAESLQDLAGVPIGVGSNTILEYVMDRLMEGAGISDSEIVVEELQKLPVRYQAMMSGEVEAAALPGTLLALGEANGCKLIADDTAGDNLSQSVMIARADYVRDAVHQQLIESLETVWNDAVKLLNADPEAYRAVLVQHASLPDAIADSYPISEYPSAALPTAAMVDPVLEWMEGKGYLTQPVEYDESDGTFKLQA